MQQLNHTDSKGNRGGLNRGTALALLAGLGFFCAVTFFGLAHYMVPQRVAPAVGMEADDSAPGVPALRSPDGTEVVATAEPAAAPEAEAEAATEAPEPRVDRRPRPGRRPVRPAAARPTASEPTATQPSNGISPISDDPLANVDFGDPLDA